MVNKVILMGHLGRNAESKTAQNGREYTVLNLATQGSSRNGKGEYETRTDWHRVYAWGKVSKTASTLQKGQLIVLEGELHYREIGSRKQRTAVIQATRVKAVSRLEVAAKPIEDEQGSTILQPVNSIDYSSRALTLITPDQAELLMRHCGDSDDSIRDVRSLIESQTKFNHQLGGVEMSFNMVGWDDAEGYALSVSGVAALVTGLLTAAGADPTQGELYWHSRDCEGVLFFEGSCRALDGDDWKSA